MCVRACELCAAPVCHQRQTRLRLLCCLEYSVREGAKANIAHSNALVFLPVITIIFFFTFVWLYRSRLGCICTMIAYNVGLLLGLAAALPLLVSAAMFPANSPVVQLNQSTFKAEVLDIEKPTLVAFTAPWCGHCQRLAPEFHKAAVNLDGIVKFANLDCDQDVNKGICAQHQIQGFPTIKLFPATKKRLARDYRGERTAKALVEFAKDTLPMGVRKLKGEELEGWVNESPARPKVILFSTKPKSSPLYRSLALDFRKTMDFAFMRGDEQLVRSTGRLVLGIDIPTAATLPVLMIVPARQPGDDGEFQALEKGKFETYVGPLKYRKIKAWLDEVGPRVGAGKSGKVAARANKAKVQPDVKRKQDEEVIPEGGFVEWKAQNPRARSQSEGTAESSKASADRSSSENGAASDADDEPVMDESAPGKNTWRGKMLDIERAGELADKFRAEAEEVGRRTRKFASLFSPPIKEEGDGNASDQLAGKAENGETDEGSLLEKVKAAAGSVADKASKAYDDASQAVFDAAKNVHDQAQEKARQVGQTGKPFDRKSEALMQQFQKWMKGEAPQEWEEQLGDQFARAQAEAEELLRNDPEEAARQAWQSEEWLLKQMRGDRDRMADVMTVEQKAQVDNMIELIENRMANKERMSPFQRDKNTQFPFAQDTAAEQAPPVVHQDATKQSHDEL